MTDTTRFWWLRHAPTAAQTEGRIPDADAEADVSDAARLATLRRRLPARALWIASPTRRAVQTVKALTHVRPLLIPALTEQDFGAWTGQRHADLWGSGEAAYRAYWDDPVHKAPPGGESYAAQFARTAAAIRDLTTEHSGLDLILVAHAGTIRAALALALTEGRQPPPLAASMGFSIDPLSLTRIDAIGPGWRIGGVNLLSGEDAR